MECERQNSFLCWWLADPESSYFGSVEVISLARDSSNKNYILFVTKHDTMTWENITDFGNIHFQSLHICKLNRNIEIIIWFAQCLEQTDNIQF